MTDSPKRRWFRFSLRTLFAAVALLCFFLAVEVHRARTIENAQAQVESLGGFVFKGHRFDSSHKPKGFLWQLGFYVRPTSD